MSKCWKREAARLLFVCEQPKTTSFCRDFSHPPRASFRFQTGALFFLASKHVFEIPGFTPLASYIFFLFFLAKFFFQVSFFILNFFFFFLNLIYKYQINYLILVSFLCMYIYVCLFVSIYIFLGLDNSIYKLFKKLPYNKTYTIKHVSKI